MTEYGPGAYRISKKEIAKRTIGGIRRIADVGNRGHHRPRDHP